MKLSTKGRYGLRAILDLALHSGPEETVCTLSISQRQGISENYLEQLMRLMKKANLIASVRGAGGGYRLTREPSEISVGDVLRALEGDLNPVDCSEITGAGFCEGADNCVTKYVWKKMNDAIQAAVDGISLEELMNESRQVNRQDTEAHVQLCERKQA